MNDNDNIQSEGRDANAAQPSNASANKKGAERYPKVRQDDAVTGEDRAFGSENPEPPQGAGDSSPTQDRTGGVFPGTSCTSCTPFAGIPHPAGVCMGAAGLEPASKGL